jgi:hypothetical protein
MSRNYTRLLIVFLVAAVAVPMAMAGGVAALETTQPADSNVGPSDLNDTATIDGFSASDSDYSILELKTPSANTTDALTVDIIAENNTHASYDTLDDAYTLTEGVDTNGDSTTDSDLHTFNVSHADLETVPVEANGQTTITVEVSYEYTDGSSNTGTADLSFDATLNATGERTVLYITDSNIDDDSMGGTVSTTDVEPAWYDYNGETTTQYDLDDELAVDGANTTITAYFNGDVASAFEDQLDEDAESGDLVLGHTLATGEDGDLRMEFLDETNEDLVNDSATYGVYDDSSDSLTVEVGDEHSDASTVSVRAVSDAPKNVDDGDAFESAAYAEAFADANFGFGDLGVMSSSFGWGGALSVLTSDLPLIGSSALLIFGGRRISRE